MDNSVERARSLTLPLPYPTDAQHDATFRFEIAGVCLDVPRWLLQPEIWQALSEGTYETAEIAAIDAALHPGDVVLELGAGIGFISSWVKTRGDAARVVAIEADPRLMTVLAHNHALNGAEVDVRNGVVGAHDGETSFFLHREFWRSSPLNLEDRTATTLPALSLSSLVADIRPTVIIADIEGGEANLFENATLDGVRTLVIEVHQHLIGLAGIKHCTDALSAAGFAYDATASRGSIIVFSRI